MYPVKRPFSKAFRGRRATYSRRASVCGTQSERLGSIFPGQWTRLVRAGRAHCQKFRPLFARAPEEDAVRIGFRIQGTFVTRGQGFFIGESGNKISDSLGYYEGLARS